MRYARGSPAVPARWLRRVLAVLMEWFGVRVVVEERGLCMSGEVECEQA
jgi:hypothetical protein